jgi:hypothetical protein
MCIHFFFLSHVLDRLQTTFLWYPGRRQDHAYIPYDVINIHDLTDVDVLRHAANY